MNMVSSGLRQFCAAASVFARCGKPCANMPAWRKGKADRRVIPPRTDFLGVVHFEM